MAAERTDRERFSHREAYERWTGDYWKDDDREPDRDAIAAELLKVMAKNRSKPVEENVAETCANVTELSQEDIDKINAELQQEHELYLDNLETELP
jgi:hypothetical protein